jgi:hypothetical protein
MSAGGISSKWTALNDERDALRAERDDLQREVARLLAERQSADALKEFGLAYSEDEQACNNALQFVYDRITSEWKLQANQFELVAAIHVIQSFIIQHMLGRLAPGQWAPWWATEPEEERKEE